jgi:hypothetical protein
MKKTNKIKQQQKSTILAQPAYWRLRAEIMATQDMLQQAWLTKLAESNLCRVLDL